MSHPCLLYVPHANYFLSQGQYTKLSPRATFTVQAIGGVIVCHYVTIYDPLLMYSQGGLLNYVIMKSVLAGNRAILLDVQGSNVWSGQQVCGWYHLFHFCHNY